MKVRFFTSALCVIFSITLLAQKQLVLREKTKIPVSQRKIVGSFVGNSSGTVYRIFELSSEKKRIEKGPFAGIEFTDKQNGLLLTNGTEVLLGKSEQIVSHSLGQLRTIIPN